MARGHSTMLLAAAFLFATAPALAGPVRLSLPESNDPRMGYGAAKLREALARAKSNPSVEISIDRGAAKPESYRLVTGGGRARILAADPAGAMYGSLDLAARLSQGKPLPAKLDVTEAPALSLRGTCVFLMKLGTYDYPVTPTEFPFFYDKTLWLKYLDYLATNRFNYIAFWNGHPFDYFVKLDKYPEAQDGMAPGLVEKNHDMLMWLGKEAEKRNIWLMFQFYNIHASVYLKKAHGLAYKNSTPTPLMADYTSYSIQRFVSEFPSVGLYICPGEGLKLEYTDSWINDVIFPAVKRTGKNPPIMIRAWAIDLPHMRKVAGNYEPLYTERKFNVEMIASTQIDPENADWARITGKHVVNIHLMGNLEPFRWSPPTYIRKMTQSSIRAGATGLHLYPRKVWRWPYGGDRVPTPELQWDRDWMWFESWARYAWNANREPAGERKFWIDRLTRRFGNAPAARHVLDAYEAGADVLPGIQRLVWLHFDNHYVVSAGILLDQLERGKGIPFLELPGLVRIPRYLEGLRRGAKVAGETPIEFLAAREREAERALAEARMATRTATSHQAEAQRIMTDAEAVLLVARFYHHKMQAAAARASGDAGHARTLMQASLQDFRDLTRLTTRTYDSISDVPMGLPVRFKPDICPYHWSDVLPFYEKEFEQLR